MESMSRKLSLSCTLAAFGVTAYLSLSSGKMKCQALSLNRITPMQILAVRDHSKCIYGTCKSSGDYWMIWFLEGDTFVPYVKLCRSCYSSYLKQTCVDSLEEADQCGEIDTRRTVICGDMVIECRLPSAAQPTPPPTCNIDAKLAYEEALDECLDENPGGYCYCKNGAGLEDPCAMGTAPHMDCPTSEEPPNPDCDIKPWEDCKECECIIPV
jgi:hypothetical protein